MIASQKQEINTCKQTENTHTQQIADLQKSQNEQPLKVEEIIQQQTKKFEDIVKASNDVLLTKVNEQTKVVADLNDTVAGHSRKINSYFEEQKQP